MQKKELSRASKSKEKKKKPSALSESYSKELAWLEEHLAEVLVHSGEWLVISPKGIVGFGKTIEEAERAAAIEFEQTPLLLKVPTEEELQHYEPARTYTKTAAVYPPMGFKYPALTTGEKVLNAMQSEKGIVLAQWAEAIGGITLPFATYSPDLSPERLALTVGGTVIGALLFIDSLTARSIPNVSRAFFKAKLQEKRQEALEKAMPKPKRKSKSKKRKRK